VLPHGAGHSYIDAALNTGGVVIDLKPMRRMLSWDAAQGIMRVEPGVTLGEMVQVAWKDGWWPAVSPSTPAVTIGGCAAMNVNGKNAWKCGPFGEHIRAIDVMLASGDLCTLTPERDAPLFHAFIGSMGLLGIITSITVQLQHINSGRVTIRQRLIPFRNLTSNIEMGKARQGTEAFRIISQSRQSLTKRLNDPIERRKDAVVEVFFAQFVPNMLDGIQLGLYAGWGINRILIGITSSWERCQPAWSTCITMKWSGKLRLTCSRKRFIIAVEVSGKMSDTK
jgi:hypothetical protein